MDQSIQGHDFTRPIGKVTRWPELETQNFKKPTKKKRKQLNKINALNNDKLNIKYPVSTNNPTLQIALIILALFNTNGFKFSK